MRGCKHSGKHYFVCGGCDKVSYCGAKCADKHWEEEHHLVCIAGRPSKQQRVREADALRAKKYREQRERQQQLPPPPTPPPGEKRPREDGEDPIVCSWDGEGEVFERPCDVPQRFIF